MYLNNSQSYIFALILTFVVGFVACEKSSFSVSSVPYGTFIKLNAQEKVNFENANSPRLTLEVTHIKDNFCPDHVQCITAGYAEVQVNVQENEKENQTFSLYYGDYYGTPQRLGFKPDTINVSLNGKGYQVILRSVKKEPETGSNLMVEITLKKM
ncbi:MAG: hypothetical protein IE931_09050 [Sphingobacteriales bacterium]|nr:hypothetical protein [Sphingobacteriales bacterium]